MEEINWEKIRMDYISGDISHKKLAKKYNVPLYGIQSRSRLNDWAGEKVRYKAELRTKTRIKTLKAQSSRNSKVLNAWDELLIKSVKAIKDEMTIEVNEMFGSAKKQQYILDAKVELMSRTIERIQRGMRLSEGKVSPDVEAKITTERERLAFEREKLQKMLDMKSDVDDENTGVVILPALAPLQEDDDSE